LTGTARREFTDVKREAVGLLATSGRPLSQTAQELGSAASRQRAWRSRGDRGTWDLGVCAAGTSVLHGVGDSKEEAGHFLGSATMKLRLIEDQRNSFAMRVHVRCAGRLAGGILRLARSDPYR